MQNDPSGALLAAMDATAGIGFGRSRRTQQASTASVLPTRRPPKVPQPRVASAQSYMTATPLLAWLAAVLPAPYPAS